VKSRVVMGSEAGVGDEEGVGVKGIGEGEGRGEDKGTGGKGEGVRGNGEGKAEGDGRGASGEGSVRGRATNRLPLPGWQADRKIKNKVASRKRGIGVNGWFDRVWPGPP
jgi:hypothetical protein